MNTTDWQTIEGAPLDGTQCWLALWANGAVGTERCVVRGYFIEGKWLAADDHETLHPPTHWIRIVVPNPPR